MKYLITAILLLFTLNANGQNIYVSADMDRSFQTVNRVDLGISFPLSNSTDGQIFTGYTTKANAGNYAQLGIGLQHNFEIPFTFAVDGRGVFGKKQSASLQQTSLNEIGVAYSVFAGVRIGAVAIGSTLEQYVLTSDDIFISPVAIRANF